MPTVQEMRQMSDRLTKTQSRIFEDMLRHPEAVCYETLRDISRRIGVAEVSVLNMCRNLGCSGYSELKEAFRAYIGTRLQNTYHWDYTLETLDESSYCDRLGPVDAMLDTEKEILASLSRTVPQEEIARCADTLMHARAVLIYGHDASKVLGDYLAHRLNYLRIKASSFRLGDSSTVETSLSMAGPEDAVVLFSFPPYYNPISNTANYAEYRGAKTVVITDSPQSPAVTEACQKLFCNTKTKFFFNTLTGPFSLIGVLTSCIALKMGPAFRQILEEELTASRSMGGEDVKEGDGESW